MLEPTIPSPDACTRSCQVCGCAYDASDFDDPGGNLAWTPPIGPCCFHGPSFGINQADHVAPPFQSILPWAQHTATQKAEARWNLKTLRTQARIVAP
jgi:hypothetical protein